VEHRLIGVPILGTSSQLLVSVDWVSEAYEQNSSKANSTPSLFDHVSMTKLLTSLVSKINEHCLTLDFSMK